jgi:aryl-alcohol dehydrogenase
MTLTVAAVAPEPGAPFELVELNLGDPRPHEVLVRIAGVGVCHTDLVAQLGYFRAYGLSMPAIFGHEGAGVVEEVGSSVTKVRPGDRVAMTFLSCGECPRCSRGAPAYCDGFTGLNYAGARTDGSRTASWGEAPISASFFGQSSFASYAIASERNIVRVRSELPLDIAGVLGCGAQTGAGAILRSLDCQKGRSLVVLGGGAVGLAAVMAAKIRGLAEIIVVEPHLRRRELALELGATHVIDPMIDTVASSVKAVLPRGVDYVFDTTGAKAVIDVVPEILASLGAFGFVGVPSVANINMPPPGSLMAAMRGGWTFRGIIEGDSDVDPFMAELMDYYVAGNFPFDKMVTRYKLSEINQAIEDQHKGLCVKPVLIP